MDKSHRAVSAPDLLASSSGRKMNFPDIHPKLNINMKMVTDTRWTFIFFVNITFPPSGPGWPTFSENARHATRILQ